MKLLLSLAFLASCCQLIHSRTTKCGRSVDKQADVTTSKIICVGTGRRFPESHAEVPEFCKESLDYVKHMENYTKSCLEKFTKQIGSVLMFTIGSQAKGLCAKRSKRLDDLLMSARCGNDASDDLYKCNIEIIDTFLGIMQVPDPKIRVKLTCCAYIKLFECGRQRMERFASCDDKKIEIITRFMEALTGPAADMLCPSWDSGEWTGTCDSLKYAVPKRRDSKRRPKSFLMPLIDILDSIPEPEDV